MDEQHESKLHKRISIASLLVTIVLLSIGMSFVEGIVTYSTNYPACFFFSAAIGFAFGYFLKRWVCAMVSAAVFGVGSVIYVWAFELLILAADQ